MKPNYGIIFFICVFEGCYSRSLNYDKPGPGQKYDVSDRIVNGTRVERRDRYPAQALLFYRGWYRCGGTIIDENHVITAAHCVIYDEIQRYGFFTIAVGKYKLKRNTGSEQFRLITDVIVHKDYTRGSYPNDLALLQLEKPLEFNRKVQPAVLSTSVIDKTTINSKTCFATGFGVIDDGTQKLATILQEIKTTIISRKTCIQTAEVMYGLGDLIYKKTVCTLDINSGVCQGDSGGPVGCFDAEGTFYQVGVLSWGSTICAEGFNVFIRISKYLNWINTVISRV